MHDAGKTEVLPVPRRSHRPGNGAERVFCLGKDSCILRLRPCRRRVCSGRRCLGAPVASPLALLRRSMSSLCAFDLLTRVFHALKRDLAAPLYASDTSLGFCGLPQLRAISCWLRLRAFLEPPRIVLSRLLLLPLPLSDAVSFRPRSWRVALRSGPELAYCRSAPRLSSA